MLVEVVSVEEDAAGAQPRRDIGTEGGDDRAPEWSPDTVLERVGLGHGRDNALNSTQVREHRDRGADEQGCVQRPSYVSSCGAP